MALSSLYNDERYGDAMSLENVVQNGELLDCYGELLTPRQRECLDLYYNENLTLAEIAEYFHISRQAVHDAMRHGEEQLRTYESALHLAEAESLEGMIPEAKKSEAEPLLRILTE